METLTESSVKSIIFDIHDLIRILFPVPYLANPDEVVRILGGKIEDFRANGRTITGKEIAYFAATEYTSSIRQFFPLLDPNAMIDYIVSRVQGVWNASH